MKDFVDQEEEEDFEYSNYSNINFWNLFMEF